MRSQRETWGATLVELAETNGDILVLDGDLANSTKADLFAEAHPARFIELGIAEQAMVGVAAGLASLGFVPWLSSFAVFLTHRSLDQIRLLVAQPGANVKIGAAYAGLLTGLTGKTHQDVQDLAIMRAMPGMTVLAPGDDIECAAMVRWATDIDGPVYLRLTRDPTPRLFDDTYEFAPGRVHRLREGRDAVLVSTGPQTSRCLAAASILATGGIDAGVVHIPSIKPVDGGAILTAARAVDLVVTVEEHSVIGGLGGLVAETVAVAGHGRLVRIGLEDCWGESAPNAFLLDRHGLSPERIADRVRRELGGSGRVASSTDEHNRGGDQ
ncbi:MAG: transketolase family protein [Chloroflexi bacterium]|nr:transketolase family protein [Chloroflexota bacterium]